MDIIKNLIDFANKIFDAAGWPDNPGHLDGGDLQDIAVECGLLLEEVVHSPCGENCNCLEFFGSEDFKNGVVCYRKVLWLNADVIRAAQQGEK